MFDNESGQLIRHYPSGLEGEIAAFIIDRQARGRSERTIEYYSDELCSSPEVPLERQEARGTARIVRRRQQEEFVGRQQELVGYRPNLAMSFDDENRRFVYAISGQGGVGKTWLMRRFRKAAEERATVAT